MAVVLELCACQLVNVKPDWTYKKNLMTGVQMCLRDSE